jgi:hypothetical protein
LKTVNSKKTNFAPGKSRLVSHEVQQIIGKFKNFEFFCRDRIFEATTQKCTCKFEYEDTYVVLMKFVLFVFELTCFNTKCSILRT